MATNWLCAKFKKDGIVCPPSLKKGLFLNAAVDGTSITFFQHPKSEVTGTNHFTLENDANNLPNSTLLKSYWLVVNVNILSVSYHSRHQGLLHT